jgi:hypothetical protein
MYRDDGQYVLLQHDIKSSEVNFEALDGKITPITFQKLIAITTTMKRSR